MPSLSASKWGLRRGIRVYEEIRTASRRKVGVGMGACAKHR
jgi:hypothetical protein